MGFYVPHICEGSWEWKRAAWERRVCPHRRRDDCNIYTTKTFAEYHWWLYSQILRWHRNGAKLPCYLHESTQMLCCNIYHTINCMRQWNKRGVEYSDAVIHSISRLSILFCIDFQGLNQGLVFFIIWDIQFNMHYQTASAKAMIWRYWGGKMFTPADSLKHRCITGNDFSPNETEKWFYWRLKWALIPVW